MDTNVTKKHLLTLIITLTLILSVTLMLPKSANATSKEYEVYKKIETGMTATQVAKLVYGKKYKSHLKKEYGVTTLKGNPLYFGGTEDRMIYEFGFYEAERKSDKEPIAQITIGLFTKSKGKTLYVGVKNYNAKSPTVNRFHKNKKPKVGMSTSQLDEIIYGNGLGVFHDITYENLTFLKILNDKGKNMFPSKTSRISYAAKSYSKKTDYLIYLEYNYKKEKYFVTEVY
ncbi:hypothetical protein QK289_12405 [Exiguobacterium antarcticum]|uniref:Uncharacterized protein n=1 Tax=Exiguobacterium antarcticum TaxID=132920 RepID=A0ABT6R4V9_9BACL|nr:hypothetical protein [Exiguobacterium antarcticum]MDI3235812.1 hypothetical protein [Exiguobacterium antarcticum]